MGRPSIKGEVYSLAVLVILSCGFFTNSGLSRDQSGYTLTPGASQVPPSGSLSISWIAPSGRPPTDWIALYRVGDPNTSYGWWHYTQGATSGTFNLTSPAQAGLYEFRYLLQDGYNVAATSTTVIVTVLPTISLTAPANNATFTAPANVTFEATASDADGSVARVDFYEGTTKVGEDANSPYSFAWNNVSAASYVLTARVIDNLGATTTSNAVNVTVNPPTTGVIWGRVTKLDGTTPIASASVRVFQGSTTVATTNTNASGDYTAAGLDPATYTVEVTASGYEIKSQGGVSVTAGNTTTVNMSLTPASNFVNYFYDEIGRLVGVVDPVGDAARYSFDAVGNLLSISRYTATQVSVIEFTPDSGSVGSQVQIYGTGFSTTATQNSVTFNGVAATVTSATLNRIITSVPSGATTGAIAVTTPNGSATSSTSFTVSTTAGVPTVSGFSPGVVNPGSAVTISGTNFETTPLNNSLKFNIVGSYPTASTATSISTTAPTAGSGRVSVATATGTAVSSGDVIILPSNYVPSDLESGSRMPIGQTQSLAVNSAGKISVMLFDGAAGQRVSIRITNISVAFGAIKIYRPDGGLVASEGWNGLTQSYFRSMILPTNGTYTILLDPDSSYTGSGNVTLYNVPPDLTGTIAIGGSATVTTTVPGQNAALSFTASAGQKVSLSMSNATLSGVVIIRNIYGGLLATTATASAGAFIDSHTLPWTGTYGIFIDPADASTGNLTLTLNNTADVVAPIMTNGTPVTVTMSVPGQIARLPLSGTTSQRVSLVTSNETVTIGFIKYLNPDGSQLFSNGIPTVTHFFEPVSLTATGSHEIIVDPSDTFTGSITLKLYDVPADVTGTITMGGPVVNVPIGVPGQNAQLTFSATAGQLVSLTDTNSTIPAYTLSIKKPDGLTLASTTTAFLDVQTLPVTGTYTLSVNPTNASTGTANLTLHNAGEVTASITAGGSAVTVTMTLPGQNARLSFSGSASQKVSLNLTATSMLGFVRVYNPDGSLLVNSGSGPLARFIDTWTLPVTGTYSILVDPQDTATGSVTCQLYDVVDVTGTTTIGGGQVGVNITTPGQNGFLTFSGTASQQVTVQVPVNGIGSTIVRLLHPDGNVLATGSGPTSFNLPQVTLPVTGTYTIKVDPSGAGTGTLQVNVTSP